MRTVSGVVLACIASATFNAAIALQALEARAVPNEFGLRISLIGKLVRRRRWLAGSALAVLAFLTQTAALLLAPLTVVQTADGAGLLLLLYLGSRHLGERVVPGRAGEGGEGKGEGRAGGGPGEPAPLRGPDAASATGLVRR